MLAEKRAGMMNSALEALIRAPSAVTVSSLASCKSRCLLAIEQIPNTSKLPPRRTVGICYRGCMVQVKCHCLAEEFDLRWSSLLKAEAVADGRIQALFVENQLVQESVPKIRFKVEPALEREALEARQLVNNLLDPSTEGDSATIKETSHGSTQTE